MVLGLQSCALLFNRPNKKVMVYASPDQLVVYKDDTLPYRDGAVPMLVPRAKDPLIFYVKNDSVEHQVIVPSKLSAAFWLTLGVYSGVGMIADAFTPKRFTYPSEMSVLNLQSDTIIHRRMSYSPAQKTFRKQQEGHHLLKAAPLRLMNFIQPSLELSYEVRNNAALSTQLTAAIMYPRGYRVALEEKFYLERSAPFGTYVSLGVDFHHNQFKRVNHYIDKDLWTDTLYTWSAPDSVMYADSVRVDRKVVTANLKIGYQGGKGRFVYDVYFGVGYRYRDVVHYDRINSLDLEPTFRHPNIFMTMDEGKFSTPNMTAGFRIGYVFPYRERAVVEESFE